MAKFAIIDIRYLFDSNILQNTGWNILLSGRHDDECSKHFSDFTSRGYLIELRENECVHHLYNETFCGFETCM